MAPNGVPWLKMVWRIFVWRGVAWCGVPWRGMAFSGSEWCFQSSQSRRGPNGKELSALLGWRKSGGGTGTFKEIISRSKLKEKEEEEKEEEKEEEGEVEEEERDGILSHETL